jgi:hypothetical protein
VDREPLVGDASLGAVLVVLPWARLTYTHTFRSKEFEGQRNRAQFGAVSLSFRF